MTLPVYTDGSALSNPTGPAGWAWFVDEQRWAAGGFRQASNQYAELFAICASLRATPPTMPLNIHTDSLYAINCLTVWVKGWKRNGWRTKAGTPVANASLIGTIVNLMDGRFVTFTKVKGHSGIFGNDKADMLCTAASQAVKTGQRVNSGSGWRS